MRKPKTEYFRLHNKEVAYSGGLIQDRVSFSIPEGNPEGVISEIEELASGFKNPEIEFECWDDWPSFYMTGWRTPTEEEAASIKKQREKKIAENKKTKQKQIDAELAQLAKLKEKYEK